MRLTGTIIEKPPKRRVMIGVDAPRLARKISLTLGRRRHPEPKFMVSTQ